jgi:hypothetical protein
MIGFYFKVNSVFVGLVKALNPQVITSYPRIICGHSMSISNGGDTVYYVDCKEVQYGVENYNLVSIYQA